MFLFGQKAEPKIDCVNFFLPTADICTSEKRLDVTLLEGVNPASNRIS